MEFLRLNTSAGVIVDDREIFSKGLDNEVDPPARPVAVITGEINNFIVLDDGSILWGTMKIKAMTSPWRDSDPEMQTWDMGVILPKHVHDTYWIPENVREMAMKEIRRQTEKALR